MGSAKWCDFDNDGFLDLFLTGDSPEGIFAKIYKNSGNSSFSEVTDLPFTGVIYSSVDIGDYDIDGDMDLIITGYTLNGLSFINIYRNDGNWIFTIPSSLTLPSVLRGSARWGDMDNDSDLDILITGWNPFLVIR